MALVQPVSVYRARISRKLSSHCMETIVKTLIGVVTSKNEGIPVPHHRCWMWHNSDVRPDFVCLGVRLISSLAAAKSGWRWFRCSDYIHFDMLWRLYMWQATLISSYGSTLPLPVPPPPPTPPPSETLQFLWISTMGGSSNTESSLLIIHRTTSKPAPKFLGLAPEPLHPYLELIRLDKVLRNLLECYWILTHFYLSQLERNSCFGPLVKFAARHAQLSFHWLILTTL